MRTLATSEKTTNFNLYLGAVRNGLVPLHWQHMNGIIIPGKPGSSKTNTAVWLANQLAANGVKLVRLDYFADDTNEQTFIYQTQHLEHADYLPPATELEDIESNIMKLYELGIRRRTAGTADNLNKFPIAIFIDEVTSLLAKKPKVVELTSTVDLGDGVKEKTKQKKRTMLEVMNDIIRMFRKENIKFIVMGQDWTQSGTTSGVATFRSNFNTVLFHRIAPKDVLLFEIADRNLQREIQNLKPGQMIYQNTKILVPNMANLPDVKQVAVDESLEYPKTVYTNNPAIDTPIYIKYDGRWNNTRVLAHLLDVDYNLLKDKRRYG